MTDIELTSPRFSWSWTSSNLSPESPGYKMWYVMDGALVAETPKHRWDIPACHCLLTNNHQEPVTLMSSSNQAVTLAILDYRETNPGTPSRFQCWKPRDSGLVEMLIRTAYQRMLYQHQLEANTLLEAILDDIFLGLLLPSRERAVLDSTLAHELTQTNLKKIDWSTTQRLLSSQKSK